MARFRAKQAPRRAPAVAEFAVRAEMRAETRGKQLGVSEMEDRGKLRDELSARVILDGFRPILRSRPSC